MSQQSMKRQTKNEIDTAIAAGVQPNAPRSGLGLVLRAGARFRTLYNAKGITEAGKYYYDKTGISPPKTFDYQQDAVRKGAVNTSNFWMGGKKR